MTTARASSAPMRAANGVDFRRPSRAVALVQTTCSCRSRRDAGAAMPARHRWARCASVTMVCFRLAALGPVNVALGSPSVSHSVTPAWMPLSRARFCSSSSSRSRPSSSLSPSLPSRRCSAPSGPLSDGFRDVGSASRTRTMGRGASSLVPTAKIEKLPRRVEARRARAAAPSVPPCLRKYRPRLVRGLMEKLRARVLDAVAATATARNDRSRPPAPCAPRRARRNRRERERPRAVGRGAAGLGSARADQGEEQSVVHDDDIAHPAARARARW